MTVLTISSPPDFVYHARKSITFTGGSGLGLKNTKTTFFNITGHIWIHLITGIVEDTLTESAPTAQISCGIVDATASFMAAENVGNLATGKIWGSGAPGNQRALATTQKDMTIGPGGASVGDIVTFVTNVQNVTGGTLRLELYWSPLADGAIATPA